MNFIKSSVLYNYLYSPQNWLHKQKSRLKTFLVLVHLLFLPYFQIKLIYIYLFFCLLICQSVYLPIIFYFYFYQIIFIFSFLIIISLENRQKILKYVELKRKYVKAYPVMISYNNEVIITGSYYLPLSLIRLFSLNFLSLILMKLLLLTTKYRNILDLFYYYYKYYLNQKIILEFQIAIQFLKLILEQIEIIKVGYTTRSITLQALSFLEILQLYLLCVQKLIISIRISVYSIVDTLRNCKIDENNLNIFYTKG